MSMNNFKNTKALLVAALFVTTFSLSAQDDNNTSLGALITDRPDATESPTVIPKGYLQVETGSFFESFDKNSFKTESFTFNTTLLRIGLLNNLELRVGWDFTEISTSLNGNKLSNVASGLNPLLFGFKSGIAKEKGAFPEIGILGHIYLPFTASRDFKPETTGVDFRFSFAHTLSESSSLSYNLGAAWGDDSSEASYVYTIAYGQSISDKLGAYVELYGDMPENSSSNHFWDAGLTYLLSDSVQLDATIGSSITEGQDLLLSAGISFRLPTQSRAQ